MPNILVTGSTGFVGSHIIDYILSNHKNYNIVATKRRRSDMNNVAHLMNNDKVKFVDCNIEDSKSVEMLFSNGTKYEKCFHLAAQSFVKFSWDSPTETLNTNIIGTLNLLESFRKFNPECVIQIASSSETYGYQEKFPLKEDVFLRPLSPYAVSKVGEENLAYQYFKSYGLKTVLTRTFNHEGPRRGEQFVTSSFAKQIVEIEKGYREAVIYHGNLDSYRDYTDVRDIVHAYWLATEKCEYGEPYNVCSGNLTKISDVLDILLSHSNIKIERREDLNRLRPSDLTKLQGDNSKFLLKTGWKPTISVEVMLKDILNYWREKI